MRLIGLAVVLTAALNLAPVGTAAAQPPEKVPRVGYISPGSSSDPMRLRRFEAFREGLRELGYVEGQNMEPRQPSASPGSGARPMTSPPCGP